MISALIPSRGHPELLERSVRSLLDHAARPDRVEITVAADDDDPETIIVAQRVAGRVVIGGRRGYARLHEYYQQLASFARGTWLLAWNDDATMLTHGWDTVIEALPASVLVADIQTPYSPLCCFPAVRFSAVFALGRFSTDNPHVDTFWQDIGRMTGTIASVPVHASLESPVKPGQTHGFYDPAHQAELRECARVIREAFS